MVSSGSPCLSISPGTPSSGAVSRRPFHSQRPSPTPHSRAFDDFFFFFLPYLSSMFRIRTRHRHVLLRRVPLHQHSCYKSTAIVNERRRLLCLCGSRSHFHDVFAVLVGYTTLEFSTRSSKRSPSTLDVNPTSSACYLVRH